MPGARRRGLQLDHADEGALDPRADGHAGGDAGPGNGRSYGDRAGHTEPPVFNRNPAAYVEGVPYTPAIDLRRSSPGIPRAASAAAKPSRSSTVT